MSTFRKPMRLSLIFALCYGTGVHAEILWQTTSLTYLHGEHYRVGDPVRQVTTFEHAAGTSWGDSFLFWDHLRFNDGTVDDYGEWSPRFSLCKLEAYCLNHGDDTAFFKDFLISTTLEKGRGFANELVGIGIDLNIPGFTYFTTNFYRRHNDREQDNWQTTLTWGLPFAIGGQDFLFDGFLDYFNTTRDQRASMNWTSQVKWNIGKNFSMKNPLYLGIEYAYWNNKFGIPDTREFRTDEHNVNLLVKWHF